MQGKGYLLHVEDDDVDARLTRSAFRKMGFETITRVADAKSALAHLRDESNPLPDLVLLDWSLPGRSGEWVLKELKQDPLLCVLPVVVLSGSDDPQTIMKAYASGGRAFIEKPSDEEGYLRVANCIFQFWFGVVTPVRMGSIPPESQGA